MQKHEASILAQIGNRRTDTTGAVNAPVYFSTAYRHTGIGESTGYDYARTGNPTREVLEEAIAELECGERGFATSSGMAAIQIVFSLFEQGDHIICSKDLYGGTYRLFEGGWKRWGLTFDYVDPRDIDTVNKLITNKTKAIFIETPTNPLMQEAPINKLAHLARENQVLLIVDNTFLTPLLQKPLVEGADIVVHSATKYLGGHNDVVAGLIVANGTTVCDQLAYYQNGAGGILSAFDSWLLIRGMKTLALRMAKHEENAKQVVKALEKEEAVSEVMYPGRGGMLSFRVKDEKWINPILQNLKLISFAESLGGVESLMTYPATQTHADIPEKVRIANGVDNCLLRFSVGIEHGEDLIADLLQAIKIARSY
ncbi:methionine biosynthesis PLP-dependent protein [Shouchella patagoniensis]|uniref:methionine biosynthesis PLP-dependent protein n=1 Tax=Shouchella patagoniensis TaxID=228576 RepID=UPI000995AD0E|nr:methionine biosynthesis PLP-dependent protein [Shouchella patagoniensis]